MELSQSEIDQILSDGTGILMSATQLHHPPCLVCGKPQSRYYQEDLLRAISVDLKAREMAAAACQGDEPGRYREAINRHL